MTSPGVGESGNRLGAMSGESAGGGWRPGVRDVARAAGVSAQTVSRVINENPNIRPETRQRVLDAMALLDYRINNAARALTTRSTHTLGIVASDTNLFGPSAGIAALERAAREAGHWAASTYADADDPVSVVAAARRLLAQGVDGILLVAAHEQSLRALQHEDIPVHALHHGVGAQRQAVGAGLVIDHLYALGHRRIARISGPRDWVESAARERGVRDRLDAYALAPTRVWLGDWSAASGQRLADSVVAALRELDPPTAVAVANDQMALGVIAGLHQAGVEVPGQVSITGFDDNPDAAFYRPALTTVRLDIAGEARRLIAAALGLQAPTPAEPELLIRASSAPVPT